MNTPSVKRLREVFGDNAKLAKVIMQSGFKYFKDSALAPFRSLESVKRLVRESFGRPSWAQMQMEALNELAGFHGVEAMETTKGEYAEHLNSGDSYACTVIYWRGSFYVTSIGDFVETKERQHIRFK